MQAFRFTSSDARRGVDLLPPEPAPRPPRGGAASRNVQIVDAEFETVSATMRRGVYPVFNDNSKTQGRPPARLRGAGRFVIRWIAPLEAHLQKASPRAFAAFVAGAGILVFLFLVGLPGGASALPVPPPLAIAGVTTTLDDANGMKVLSVYGTVENRSDAARTVPVILVDVIANGTRVTASRVVFGPQTLAAGDSRPFAARLLHTGGKVPDVAVSFGDTGASTP